MKKKQRKITKSRALNQSPHDLVGRLRGGATILIWLVFVIFLFLNISQSQTISPLYFQLVNENKQATIEFLKKIKTLPQFKNFLAINQNIYGKAIENEVFSEEKQKKQLVKNLEQILIFNPRARDVLYGLYLLYRDLGNKTQAEEYLRQAKAVDPIIKSNLSN